MALPCFNRAGHLAAGMGGGDPLETPSDLWQRPFLNSDRAKRAEQDVGGKAAHILFCSRPCKIPPARMNAGLAR